MTHLRSLLCAMGSVLVLCGTSLAGLIPCPDCGKQISERAVMCPSCGCPADAIRAAAQSNQTVAVELPAFCHSLVRVTSDQGEGVGVCIQPASQPYVLTAQNMLDGAQSLTLVKALDGQPLSYISIELASDRNLVRLVVNATNLHPLAIATATNADLALVYVSTNKTVAVMQTGAVSGPLPAGTPLLDAATNLVMVVGTTNGKHAESVASVAAWVPVRPLTYRTQTTLLQQAAKGAGDRTTILEQLQETKWLTPYLAQQAETLVKELRQHKE